MPALAVIVLLASSLTQPRAARCPPGWFLSHGARRVYACTDAASGELTLIGVVACDSPTTEDGRSLGCHGDVVWP